MADGTYCILLESALAIFAGFHPVGRGDYVCHPGGGLVAGDNFFAHSLSWYDSAKRQKYSTMWWEYLISQSFFAPAFLFMFMLVTKFINSDFVDSIFKASASGTSDSMIVLGLNGGTIALTFFHFLS